MSIHTKHSHRSFAVQVTDWEPFASACLDAILHRYRTNEARRVNGRDGRRTYRRRGRKREG